MSEIPPSQGFSGLRPPGQLFANTRAALPTPPPATQTPVNTSQPPTPGPLQTLSPRWAILGQAALAHPFLDGPLQTTAPQATVPQLPLPPRQATAMTGSQFWAEVKNLPAPQREQAIQSQILQGNIPDHLRQMKPLSLHSQTAQGASLEAVAYVTPDYLAIGSNDDYVLVPMSPLTAQAIADATGTGLPTRKLVDTIYAQAQVKLKPSPQAPGPQMTAVPYFAKHNDTVAQQRNQAGAQAGDLVAGHKKDVVITPRLDQKPRSVAIYGWHQRNGKPIQPLSTLHENTYADYSHGVRLVGPSLSINGKTYTTAEVLRHPEWSKLLSDEGVVSNMRAIRP